MKQTAFVVPKNVCSQINCNVFIANSGQEAIEYSTNNPLMWSFSDARMPESRARIFWLSSRTGKKRKKNTQNNHKKKKKIKNKGGVWNRKNKTISTQIQLRFVVTGYADMQAVVDAGHLGQSFPYVVQKPWTMKSSKGACWDAICRQSFLRKRTQILQSLDWRNKNKKKLTLVNETLEATVKRTY